MISSRFLHLSLPVFFAIGVFGSPLNAEPIIVRATAVPLNEEDPAQSAVGGLRYKGGLEVTSAHGHFGGLSGLIVDADGRHFSAVSDLGHWLGGTFVLDDGGRLTGLEKVHLGALLGSDGDALKSKRKSDSEAITRFRGGFAVSFERKHRVRHYKTLQSEPEKLPKPPGINKAPDNGGIEALTALKGGGLLAISEGLRTKTNDFRGWLLRGEKWEKLTLAATGDFKPTDLAELPNGDVLALERSYSLMAGPAARISRIDAGDIRPGARLVGREIARLSAPLIVDNMEGLAVADGPNGPAIYLLSDDNFSALQRTLFLKFELAAP